jgi:lipid A ethanolaminephosphotransferase
LGSLACMLTHEGVDAPVATSWEPLPSYLHRHGVDVDWRTNSSGEPRVTASSYTTLAELRATCTGEGCERLHHEEGLLHGLRERIDASQSERMFVVLHQGNGSHGPAYHTQYPPEFEHFSPVCATVQIQNCSAEELVNAYDNTIVYTDYILRRTIDILESLERTAAVMIYISDHGQALGEGGVYLHGLPNSIAPDVMRDIPFLVWMNTAFRDWRGLTPADLERAPTHTMDHVFNSVMGAMGAESPVYRPAFDIFRTPG